MSKRYEKWTVSLLVNPFAWKVAFHYFEDKHGKQDYFKWVEWRRKLVNDD